MDSSLSSIEIRIQLQQNLKKLSRCKLGQEPQYIAPKISYNLGSQPEIMSQSQFNSSIAVPKFYNPTYQQQIKLPHELKFSKKQDNTQNTQLLPQQNTFLLSAKFIFIYSFIWLSYLVGSVQFSNQKITSFHILDCIGNAFALVLLGFTIYAKNKIDSISQVLHIWSIVLTLTFMCYPIKNKQDQIFIEVISISRIFRLLFPLFIKQTVLNSVKKLANLIQKSRKIIFFIIIIFSLISLFAYQIYSDSLRNRCRSSQFPINSDPWISKDLRLCGYRTCIANEFCKNPKQFSLQISQQQKNGKHFNGNLFTFDSFLYSIASVFQMLTLNSWNKVSNTYFDVFPAWISVPFLLIGFLLFQKLYLAILCIFFDIKKLKRDQYHLLHCKNVVLKQSSLGIPPKDDKKEQKRKINHQRSQSSQNLIVTSLNKVKQSQPNKMQQAAKFNECQQKSDELKTSTKLIIYVCVISLSITHLIIASQFGLNPTNIQHDLFNRKIGLAMVIFFIVHFFVLCLIGYEVLNFQDEQNQNKQTQNLSNSHSYGFTKKQITQTIFDFETLIFFIHLVDYIIRIAQGKYVIQETSGITSLSHLVLGLRLYYIFLAAIDLFKFHKLEVHIVTILKVQRSIFKYFLVFTVISAFFGTISHNINKQHILKSTSLSLQINRFFMFMVNHSWYNLQKFSFNEGILEMQSIYTYVIGIIFTFGSICFVQYIISHIVHESFWQSMHNNRQVQQDIQQRIKISNKISVKLIKSNKQNSSQKITTYKSFPVKDEDNEQTRSLKSEKSFFIFGYENNFRKLCLQIVKDQYYQNIIKFRLCIIYVISNFLACLLLGSFGYSVFSTILQLIILIDVLIQSVGKRFFGRFSYSQNNIISCFYVAASFLIIILSLAQTYVQAVPLLQFLKLFVILNFFDSFKQTFQFIKKASSTILVHFLLLVPIIVSYTLMILPSLSIKSINKSWVQKFGQGLKLSLVFLCQKGWDWKQIYGENNLSTLDTQLSLFVTLITYFIISLTVVYSLGGSFLSQLKSGKQKQQQQIKKTLSNSNSLLQQYKIREQISNLKPKFDYNLYGTGTLFKISQHSIYKLTKKISLLGSILCLIILNTNLTTNERIIIYSFHLFFFSIELLFFLLELISFNQNQQHYWRDLVLNVLAIPGAYIGFVNPVKYSTHSPQLKTILLIFNALTTVRFIKIIQQFQLLNNIYLYIKQKFNQTFNIALLGLVSSLSISFYLYLTLQAKVGIIECFSYVLIGLFGGDFYFNIQGLIKYHQIQLTFQHYVLYLMVHLFYIVFINLLISFAIYQLANYGKQNMSLKSTQYNLYNFNSYFHEQQFLNQWMKLDPKGKGYVNYTQILYKSHQFIRHFSITKSLYKSISNRIRIFKMLKLPIYQAQTQHEAQQSVKPKMQKQYVVNFYDFLYFMSKYAFRQMNSSKLIKKNKSFIRNYLFNEQPVSIINLDNNNQEGRMSNFSKKVTNKQKIIEDFNDKWKKQSFSRIKRVLKQKQQEHPNIPGIQSSIKSTKMNSQEIYYAHRLKTKMYRFFKKTQQSNQHKRNDQTKQYKQKQAFV